MSRLKQIRALFLPAGWEMRAVKRPKNQLVEGAREHVVMAHGKALWVQVRDRPLLIVGHAYERKSPKTVADFAALRAAAAKTARRKQRNLGPTRWQAFP